MKYSFFLLLAVLSNVATAQMPNTLTQEEKIYGISKFWQEVNYNFVYLDKVDRNQWDSLYRATISSVLRSSNDYEYYRELQRFCAFLHDGHTNVYLPSRIDTLLYVSSFGKYRLVLWCIEDKAVVLRTNPGIKDEIPVGSIITEVNGLPTDEYLERYVSPYIASSTDYVRRELAIQKMLQGLEGQTFNLRILSPDKTEKVFKLTHEKTLEKELIPPLEPSELLKFKWYEQDIAYVGLGSFDPQSGIDTMFRDKLPELQRAKGLILDLRYNGGGSTNVGTAILQYLTRDTLLYGSLSVSRLHIPAYKAWGQWVSAKDTAGNEWAAKSLLHAQDKAYYTFEYRPGTNTLTGPKIIVPTVILTGHFTASAAEDFLVYADNQKHMIRMGENSYGSTGQPLMIDLPGGGSARICTKKDTFPDGREFVGVGVKPHIEVKQTIKDWITKNDPVIARAVEYLKGKIQ